MAVDEKPAKIRRIQVISVTINDRFYQCRIVFVDQLSNKKSLFYVQVDVKRKKKLIGK